MIDFNNYKIILASKSPRRKHLLEGLEIKFEIKTKEIEEDYPIDLVKEQIPLFLCELKANAFSEELKNDKTIIITADTIVYINNHVLNKPKDFDDAVAMLSELSANKHEVITGVCLKSKSREILFCDTSVVYFKKLTIEEIKFYVNNYQPYDKAGAYGVQEWIGYIAIDRIEGSYFNVMGLPTHKLYNELLKFINK